MLSEEGRKKRKPIIRRIAISVIFDNRLLRNFHAYLYGNFVLITFIQWQEKKGEKCYCRHESSTFFGGNIAQLDRTSRCKTFLFRKSQLHKTIKLDQINKSLVKIRPLAAQGYVVAVDRLHNKIGFCDGCYVSSLKLGALQAE